MERIGLTGEIAAFAADSADASVSHEVIHALKRAVIDTIGVTLAGRGEPAVAIMSGLLPEGLEALCWPGGRRLSAKDAALLGGLAGHVLDYDDVAQHGHPSVVIVPAVLAEAQRSGSSGSDALRACAVGYEVWTELAARESDAYHLGSWHPTAMLGTISATAAVAALNGTSAEATRNALAIAASFASGVIANFGTHTKPLQAGRTAANAIEAVRLAAAGITGAADPLEGAHGLLRGISPRGNVDTAAPAGFAAGRWRWLKPGLSVKRYPVCHASHRAIDAMLDLTREAGLSAGQVRSVTVTLGQAPAETLRYDRPQTGLEARFSLNHSMAAALIDGAVGFAQLNDSYVRRPDVAALYPLTRMRIEGEECPEQPGMAKHDRVVIACTDGRELDSGPLRYPRGHARLPLSGGELDAKFLDCARHGGVTDPAELLAKLHALDEEPDMREMATW
jgi:aconitate decarboxylase